MANTIDIEKYRINCKEIKFEVNQVDPEKLTSKELKNIEDVLQERVVSAIELAININDKGYNVFAIGPKGSGKKDFIKNIINKKAIKRELFDICYVYNFENSNKPLYLKLKACDGKELKQDIAKTLEDLKVIIPSSFRSNSYLAKVEKVKQDFIAQERKDFENINACAKEMHLTIKPGEKEYGVIPLKDDGSPMQEADLKKLTKEDKENLNSRFKNIEHKLQKFLEKQPIRENELITRINVINTKQVRALCSKIFGKIKRKWNRKYQEDHKVGNYLNQLEEAVIKNHKKFFQDITKTDEEKTISMFAKESQQFSIEDLFTVHLITENSKTKNAPVVSINNPTSENLFGDIVTEYDSDKQVIKGGAFHDASGGYLILDASKVLVKPELWEQIKYTLKYQSIKIPKKEGLLSLVGNNNNNLRPEAIPSSAKVIMVGSSEIYSALIQYDNEFNNLFKAVANFTNTLEITNKTLKFFYNKLLENTKNEDILPIGKTGFAKIVKHASKEAGDKSRITANFRKMADLLRESNHVAKMEKSSEILKEHVAKAIASHFLRINILSSNIKDSIKDNTILINTSGTEVGQINGLSVYQIYGHTFGQPQRITVNSYKDNTGIINLQKNSDLSGKIYSKASLIINSYIKSTFSAIENFNFGASVNFEQTYSYVDGDSASIAEVVCLLSSLSGKKINQSLAVTGAMSQTGEVLAIGGVNEKIEGFFDVCKEKGTKNNGVVVPKTNIKNIVLREDIEKAVAEGSFAIYAVENIEQAIEIFFLCSAGKQSSDGTYKDSETVFGSVFKNFCTKNTKEKQ